MSYLKGQLSFLAGRSGAVLQSLAIKGNTQRFFSASTRATYSAHTHVQAGANYIKNQAVAMVTRARSQPVRKVAVPVVSYMVISSIFRDAAQADGIIPGGDSVGEKKEELAKKAEETAPFAGAITFGAMSGFCSGYALAKAGKGVAAFAGFVFMGMQAASYNDLLTVNWTKIEQSTLSRMDLNNDGKVDSKDLKVALSKLISILTSNMGGAGAGFGAGFLVGAKKGWH